MLGNIIRVISTLAKKYKQVITYIALNLIYFIGFGLGHILYNFKKKNKTSLKTYWEKYPSLENDRLMY